MSPSAFLASVTLLFALSPFRSVAAASPPPENRIWFDAPAKNFTESLPLGNGRLGAMFFGGIQDERIVLNESSIWSGSRQEADRPDACKSLPEIRRLLLAGKNVEAEALVNANFTCRGPGSGGGQYGCYQVLGNLHLSFPADTLGPARPGRTHCGHRLAGGPLDLRHPPVRHCQFLPRCLWRPGREPQASARRAGHPR